MAIASDLIRGHTDTIILAHLYHGESYGYEINKRIKQQSGGQYELKEATLYSAFRRMEQQGYIQSYWGDEDSGARRRYYRITDTGMDAYRQNAAQWQAEKQLIDQLISISGGEES